MDIPYELISNITNDTSATNWKNGTYYKTEGIEEESDRPGDQLPLSVTIIFIIVGTVGNCLVCLAILLNRKLQNVTNYFLFSLAITDLLVSILVLPARLITVRYKLQPSMFPLCFMYLVGDDFITAASAIHICFISFERYLAIRNPFNRGGLTRRRISIKIALVWIIAFLTIIPYMTFDTDLDLLLHFLKEYFIPFTIVYNLHIFSDVLIKNSNINRIFYQYGPGIFHVKAQFTTYRYAIITEHPDEPQYCPYLLANFDSFEIVVLVEALVIIVMVVIVVVSFALTTISLRRLIKMQQANTSINGDCGLVRTVGGTRVGNKASNKNDHQDLRSEEKAMRVIWLVAFAFIICMFPYSCTSLQFLVFPDVIIPPVLLDITAYLNYLNSLINPIIYTIFNKTFRDDFMNLILCKYKKK